MTDALADIGDEPPAKGGKKGLIFGLLGALIFGAAGFFVTYSGLLGGGDSQGEDAVSQMPKEGPKVAFVPVDPLVVSLGLNARSRHLRFGAQLEVPVEFEEEVRHLMPRVLDILNAYLRAIDSRDIENPASLIRLRAHMLRRVQTVTGQGRVRDLLITEFVLN